MKRKLDRCQRKKLTNDGKIRIRDLQVQTSQPQPLGHWRSKQLASTIDKHFGADIQLLNKGTFRDLLKSVLTLFVLTNSRQFSLKQPLLTQNDKFDNHTNIIYQNQVPFEKNPGWDKIQGDRNEPIRLDQLCKQSSVYNRTVFVTLHCKKERS